MSVRSRLRHASRNWTGLPAANTSFEIACTARWAFCTSFPIFSAASQPVGDVSVTYAADDVPSAERMIWIWAEPPTTSS